MRRAVSSFLDASVVGGYSRVGWEVRSRLGSFSPPEDMDLRGRRIVVTGPTAGLGRAAAGMLAAAGADLVLVGRDAGRTERARAEIDLVGPGSVESLVADMGDLPSVARVSAEIAARGVHAVVHNAGALDKVRGVSAQGFETTVATHVLGPYLMTRMLAGALSAADGRVVTVSSGGMYAAALPATKDGATIEMAPGEWDGTRQYAIAKRAQVVLNGMWAAAQPSVWFAAMHPGWADTPGVASSLPLFRSVTRPLLRTARQGADTIAWLAGVDTSVGASGAFWCDREIRGVHRLGSTRSADTAENRSALWDWCDGVTAPFAG